MLLQDLERLQSETLIEQRQRLDNPRYIFRHALIRDAAYESFTASARRAAHMRVGQALEERGAQAPEGLDLPSLTHHYREAECYEKAVPFARRTAQDALAKSEYQQADFFCAQALGWLPQLEDPSTRVAHELALNRMLTTARMMTRGWGAPEVEQLLARSTQLLETSQQAGGAERFATLWALATYHNVRAGHHAQVYGALDAALELPSIEDGQRAAVAALRAHTLWMQGTLGIDQMLGYWNALVIECELANNPQRASELTAAALDQCQRAGDALFLSNLHFLAARCRWALFSEQPERALSALEGAVRAAEETGADGHRKRAQHLLHELRAACSAREQRLVDATSVSEISVKRVDLLDSPS